MLLGTHIHYSSRSDIRRFCCDLYLRLFCRHLARDVIGQTVQGWVVFDQHSKRNLYAERGLDNLSCLDHREGIDAELEQRHIHFDLIDRYPGDARKDIL